MTKWTTLVVVLAVIYGAREHFHVGKYVASTFESPKESPISKEGKQTSVTGFFQATGVSLRPLSGAHEVATHMVTFPADKLAPLASFTRPLDTGVVHFTGATLKFFRDWAELSRIVQTRLAEEAALVADFKPAHRYLNATLAGVSADANRLPGSNVTEMARSTPLRQLLAAPSSIMITMAGCNATAVADIINVNVDESNLELLVRVVDEPHLVSEFKPHPMQELAGPLNHYHFHTAPGVVHDAQALMEYAASPAADGAAVGVFLKGMNLVHALQNNAAPPPPAMPARFTRVSLLAPPVGGPIFAGSVITTQVIVVTDGAANIWFRTNGAIAPATLPPNPPSPSPFKPPPSPAFVPGPPPPKPPDSTNIEPPTHPPTSVDTAAVSAENYGFSSASAGADIAVANGPTVGNDGISAQGGNVTANTWWLFPPFWPKPPSTPILFNPNPLVVSASGTYTVSIYFQRGGLYKIDAVNGARRVVTQRALIVKVLNKFLG